MARRTGPSAAIAWLGHKAGTAGRYNRANYLEERRRTLERWGAHIMGVVTGKPVDGEVVKLRRAIEGA